MNIEEELFKKYRVNYDKLLKYGFNKNKDTYIIEKSILDDRLKVVVTIDENGKIFGNIIDLDTSEEYIGFRTNSNGEFSNLVRDAYSKVLIDIRDKCFVSNLFLNEQSNRIANYIMEKYNVSPEFLWSKFDGYGVFRKKDTRKWFAIIMNIDISKIDKGHGEVEIINLKLDAKKVKDLINKPGYYESYHMNKDSWISLILNDTLKDSEIKKLVDLSYNIVK